MSIHRKLTTVCCAAVLAVGLAACGTSDDDDTSPTTGMMDPSLEDQLSDAEAAREVAENALADKEKADKAAAEQAVQSAMVADAAKLFEGLGTGPLSNHTAVAITLGDLVVTTDVPTTLSPDNDVMVPDLHGWAGKQYSMTSDGTSYTAVVYSNADAADAKEFSEVYSTPGLDSDGELVLDTGGEITGPAKVASSSFDHTSGRKNFKLADNARRVIISGTFDGASGTYYCTPAADNSCGATVAESGFTLVGGAWTFKPTGGAKATVSTRDATIMEHFGWWISKSADGFVASAFTVNDAEVPDAVIQDLQGKASYVGPAAGKYALSNSLGGPNDAGHFTAAARLEADFSADMISGTLSSFTGGDDQPRDWGMQFKKTTLSDAGVFSNLDAGTVWSIDGEPAVAVGGWSGALYKNDSTSEVPKVATGTFQSTYGQVGRMVGAFGANQE